MPALSLDPGRYLGERGFPGGFVLDDSRARRTPAAKLELGLHEQDSPGVARGKPKCGGQRLLQTDEADVGDDGLRRLRQFRRRQIPRIQALEGDDPAIDFYLRVQLPMAHVNGVNAARTPLEQDLRESSSGGADIETNPGFG